MVKVFESLDFPMVGHFRSILESSGIPCEIRNEAGMSLAGEVPFTSVFPELWVRDEADAPRAMEIINTYSEVKPESELPRAWKCPACGEEVDGIFAECWNCGFSDSTQS